VQGPAVFIPHGCAIGGWHELHAEPRNQCRQELQPEVANSIAPTAAIKIAFFMRNLLTIPDALPKIRLPFHVWVRDFETPVSTRQLIHARIRVLQPYTAPIDVQVNRVDF